MNARQLHVVARIFDEVIHRDLLRETRVRRVFHLDARAAAELYGIELGRLTSLRPSIRDMGRALVSSSERFGDLTVELRGTLGAHRSKPNTATDAIDRE